MKYKFSKAFYRVLLWWVAVWSKTYRFFAQPKKRYKMSPLKSGLSPRQAWDEVKILDWRKDDWRVLGNVIHRPEYVQFMISFKRAYGFQLQGSMDCDDFAIWCANVIDEKYEPCLLVVSWQETDGEQSGHGVCLVKDPDTGEYYHVGNWGIHGSFATMGDAIKQIKGQDTKLIGWGAYSKELKLLNWGNEL